MSESDAAFLDRVQFQEHAQDVLKEADRDRLLSLARKSAEADALRAKVKKLEADLANLRAICMEEAARCAEGPIYRTNGAGDVAIRGTDKGNWSVPMPISGYKGSDYGTGRHDAAAAIRALATASAPKSPTGE